MSFVETVKNFDQHIEKPGKFYVLKRGSTMSKVKIESNNQKIVLRPWEEVRGKLDKIFTDTLVLSLRRTLEIELPKSVLSQLSPYRGHEIAIIRMDQNYRWKKFHSHMDKEVCPERQ